MILFVVKFKHLHLGIGSWDFIIHTESSATYSPINPTNYNYIGEHKFISDPVGTPVINSKYFLRNVLPDLANVWYIVLSPFISFPSKNLTTLSLKNYFLYFSYELWSDEISISLSSYKLIVPLVSFLIEQNSSSLRPSKIGSVKKR
jgi:hypothetical protein